MKDNRRDFFKLAGMATIGLAGPSIIPGYAGQSDLPGIPTLHDVSALAALNRLPDMAEDISLDVSGR